jgi:hypothetical protein
VETVACAHCGERHDISKMEPNQRRPDALLSVPEDERGTATHESKDACILFAKSSGSLLKRFTARSRPDRYFLRVMLPFEVEGRDYPFCWGIWVEVHKHQYERVMDLWDNPNQHQEPPFEAVLANYIGDYSLTTEGLSGLVHLQSPERVPHFFLSDGSHELVMEQRKGVTEARVFEWLDPYLHGV